MNNLLGIPLPILCERGNNLKLFAEPLNTISNIAFIFAAYGIYKLLIKNKIHQVEYKMLLILILLVGFGSFLWHATENLFALILDVVPAALSFVTITYIFLKNLTGNKLFALLLAVLLFPTRFFISSFAPTDTISSLIRNLINLTTFFLIILLALKKYGKIAFEGFSVLIVYMVAIIMRIIDLQICPVFPLGTHFLWHILNALAVYLAVRFIIKLGYTS